MKELNVALIGCGNIGRLHVQNINVDRTVPGMRISAFVDVDLARAQELCRFGEGLLATADLRQVLADESIGAVLIAANIPSHIELCRRAASAGKHIFVEKPVGWSLRECMSLVDDKWDRELVILVGYCFRFSPVYQLVKEEIPRPSMTFAHVMGGGDSHGVEYLYHNLSHALNMICWLHDSHLRRVFAMATHASGERVSVEQADRWLVSLEFDNGSIASIGVGGDAPGHHLPKWYYKICGTNGVTAEVVNNQHVYFKPNESHNLEGATYHQGHIEEMKAFLTAIRTHTPAPVSVRDAALVHLILESAMKSARERVLVDCDVDRLCRQ
ncbi:MAG: Gfo/Idh/MocA family oxidoreductase [Planctomycetes bacterium]|nr:Gfo/Idh/MocA family oxidoreductase [Planctomycetota bacterium]